MSGQLGGLLVTITLVIVMSIGAYWLGGHNRDDS